MTTPTTQQVRQLSTAEYLYRQGAITKTMVALAAKLVRQLGRPTTDDQRARFARAAYPAIEKARRQSYVLAVQSVAHTAPGVEPAPLRPYSPQAIETALADLDQENTARRQRSRRSHVTVSAPDQVSRGKSRATVTTAGQIGARLARHADAAGREAVIDTAERHGKKIGWARVLSGAENCSRCVMLASRGPAYKSEKSAIIAGKGVRAGKTFHDHCDCRAVLVREGEDWDGREAHELYEDLWTEATRGYSGHAAELALRRQLDRAEREGWTHQELLERLREENRSARDDDGTDPDTGGNSPEIPESSAGHAAVAYPTRIASAASSPGGPQDPNDPNGPGGTTFGDPGDEERESYRMTAISRRAVDTRFAEDLGDVVDSARVRGTKKAKQLGEDLTGVITGTKDGELTDFVVRIKGSVDSELKVRLEGTIKRAGVEYPDDDSAGSIVRTVSRDADGDLYVENVGMFLPGSDQDFGFATAVTRTLEDYYRRSGVSYLQVFASDEAGGYVWAKQGFQWDERGLGTSIQSVVNRLRTVRADKSTTDLDRRALDAMERRLIDDDGRIRPIYLLPDPNLIAEMESDDSPDLGKRVMLGASWYGIKRL
ncbi:MAG TPA: hypothetical protein PK331_11260 [Gordonia sp. (in: high G+C Gram-positive bacteria)]|uniref:VG15 protein n=1 Tax=unclassified Gordonia (in: high G+C Gram-positive bacteria) TaxID=2657482 RepID=UPI0025BEF567|nr:MULTISPECIES: hypothetical protein [unclassified Gordonia (in: high G+C Gram-positive bacteria)]HNP57926.1 hypothetical protein [Gordonia sp. (in: high G+C Gram-positive bacteria)]HRC51480.1 hypothetical protein [Gordonia sp. (in: high G+C Gram-positive bacteria)]